jgi:hypothetical protein
VGFRSTFFPNPPAQSDTAGSLWCFDHSLESPWGLRRRAGRRTASPRMLGAAPAAGAPQPPQRRKGAAPGGPCLPGSRATRALGQELLAAVSRSRRRAPAHSTAAPAPPSDHHPWCRADREASGSSRRPRGRRVAGPRPRALRRARSYRGSSRRPRGRRGAGPRGAAPGAKLQRQQHAAARAPRAYVQIHPLCL